MAKTQKEIIEQGYRALTEALGVCDTLRFIQYFSPGEGDYTQERDRWLDGTPLDDILNDMKQYSNTDGDLYDETIDPGSSRRRSGDE